MLDTPYQTTSKTGKQPHPLSERLPKIIISSQTPQNTPPDTVLPTRKTRSSLIPSDSIEGINNRITEAEVQISDLENKIVEITTAEQNKEKRMKGIEDSLRDLWDNIKHTNIRIIGIPEEEEKRKGLRKYLKRS